MARIVALFNRDLSPVDRATMWRIAAPLFTPVSATPRIRLIGPAGLTYQSLQPSFDRNEMQPAGKIEDISICFDGRLDNREELIREVEFELDSDPRSLSDALLATACYRRHGLSFAGKLNGDFALTLYDAPHRRMLLARDVIGTRPLYYWLTGDHLVAASEIKAILAHPRVDAKPDDDAVADLLVGGNPNELHLTLFQNVRRVLPGHTVVVDPQGQRELTHWDFDPTRQIRLRNAGDYAEAIREYFQRSVSRRLRSVRPVGVFVSGGLDSSAILCQAEQLRRDGASIPPVLGVSRLYPAGSEADESRYVADIESEYGISIRRLPAAQFSTAQEAAWTWRLEYPGFPGSAYLDCLTAAQQMGCSSVLHGYYGDQLMWSCANLYDLMRGFRWIEAGRQLNNLSQSMTDCNSRDLKREYLQFFIRDLAPDWLLRPFRYARKLAGQDRSPMWYSSRLRSLSYRRSQLQRRHPGPFCSKHAEICYTGIHSSTVSNLFELSNKAAAFFGVEKAYPFADRDLVALVMSMPGDVVGSDGEFKGLFRSAMVGILPESIRRRYWKADFTRFEAEAAAGLRTDTLASGAQIAVTHGYIDDSALTDSLARHGSTMKNHLFLASKQRTELVALGDWLRVFFTTDGLDDMMRVQRSPTGESAIPEELPASISSTGI